MAKADIELAYQDGDEDTVVIRITIHDQDLMGHDAHFSLKRVVHVKDRRAINRHKTLFETRFRIESRERTFTLPRSKLGRGYAYQGQMIEIRLESVLEVDDALLFDTEVKGLHRLHVLDKPQVSGKGCSLADPEDRFNFFANLKAIPARNKMITLGLVVAGGIVILINAIVGLHDQFSPEAQTFFYSHRGSDGDGQSPLMNALMGSGAAGAAIWFAIRRQLRKYMRFEWGAWKPQPARGTTIDPGQLISAEAQVPLERVTFRVVAYNREKGQYERGSGTQRRTVSFKTPALGVKLYEKFLPHVPARAPLASYLDGQVDFEPMFKALYPPLDVGASHGIDVQWEVQLIHPDFVDHELIAPGHAYRYEDFLDG